MADTAGYIVEYTNKEGNTQKAVMRHSEQVAEFREFDKAFLRLINDDGTDKLDENGKRLIAVKSITLLKQIGFND